MKNINELYQDVKSKRNELQNEIQILENNEMVKKYFQLLSRDLQLSHEENSLYTDIMNEKYSNCNHIWVRTLLEGETSGLDAFLHNYYGCIKCGLDYKVFSDANKVNNNLDFLTLDEKVMYEYLKNNNPFRKENSISVLCDIDLAKEIYSDIKAKYPNMDDETVIMLFEKEINNIKNNVLDVRNEKLAKTLKINK